MDGPAIVSREEWLAARKELLEREKQFDRERDALSARRRALPMVEITEPYTFEGPQGAANLVDLFDGRRQLIIYHFMLAPDWDAGCTGCSLLADNIGHLAHLQAARTSFAAVSRAPLASITKFRERMGWSFPWFSSHGTSFNYDFHVTMDGSVAPILFNFRTKDELSEAGIGSWALSGEQHGLSVFLREDDRVFHTYSTYSRGTDLLNGTFNYLDLTPLGRQEEAGIMSWVRHHDDYDDRAEESGCGRCDP
ncbi:DUF899 domain-containing protein [Streptomyces sp. WAC04770]|nr:DUF899 domain-containing protein [Streptomyces sp. WAC04770]RST23148.1 DUF899 domain-containing protein [Streptomyces sp. WAC04770]